jgi:hypothetical protein
MKGWKFMVDYCANPKCVKPLHYLREGTIFIFEGIESSPGADDLHGHRLEHYWLCGDCSTVHRLERTASQELRLVPRKSLRFVRRPAAVAQRRITEQVLAS